MTEGKKGRDIFPPRHSILRIKLTCPKTLEGQIVRVSDVIAYVNHDIDDALHAGVIKEDDITRHLVKDLGQWPASRIDRMVEDVVKASLRTELDRIAMSEKGLAAVVELREFLYKRVYCRHQAAAKIDKAKKILLDLYDCVLRHPSPCQAFLFISYFHAINFIQPEKGDKSLY